MFEIERERYVCVKLDRPGPTAYLCISITDELKAAIRNLRDALACWPGPAPTWMGIHIRATTCIIKTDLAEVV